jgi:hypothetical protein
MNSIKLLILFFSTASIISCTEQSESLNGHWDLVSPEYSDLKTLDINDSLTVPNRYNLGGHISNDFPRIYESKSVMPVYDMDYSESFFIKNDTLFIEKDTLTFNYVKSDINKCILSHRYTNTFISIDLDENNSANKFESISKGSCGTNVFVGKLQHGKSHFIDSLANSFPDSVFIQVNDIAIRLSDLSKFGGQTKDQCFPREPLVYLHIDNKVPPDFIDQLLSNIPDSLNLNLNRVVKVYDGDIGLRKLQ